MTLTTEQLTSTLSEALFHYREALVLKESERDKVLPQKGKLPATDDDDALQAEYYYQVEATNRLLGSVDDMVAAINSPRESKSMVVYEAPDHPQWLEPYLKDEPFINPFTGLIVEAPASPNTISSKPGPSAKEGPLKEIPPTFWDSYDPYLNHSLTEGRALVEQKSSTVPSHSKDNKESRIGDFGHMDPYMASLKSIPTNVKLLRSQQAQIPSPGLGDIKRQNDSNFPGTWVNSWANSTDEGLDKAPVAGPSTLSRTTSKILGAGPWKTWAPRTRPFAAIQLGEMRGNKANKHEKGKRPNEQRITAPETQIDEVEKTVRFSTKAASFEIGGDGFQLYEPTAERPVTTGRPNTSKNSISSSSSIETSSSGVSSTLRADWLADDERRASDFKLFRDFSDTEETEPSSGRGGKFEHIHPLRKDPVPVQVADNPLDSPAPSRQEYEFPEYSPKSDHGSGSHNQADSQRPSDLFDDEDGGPSSPLLLCEQLQRDRELAEMISAGLDPDMDPETLELIKRLSEDSPQDFDQFLDQEAEREALLAEITGQDLRVLQDWELAMQLAEGSPQDMEEHMRQIREQEEYARLQQEAWDEDIRRIQREEIARLEEEVRRERMADCTACSEEGEKLRMAMLPCNHGYCSACIRLAFEGALKEKKPFRCCDQVPIDSITAHFPEHFVRDYNDLMLELNTQNPLYCSARGCSKFIPPTSIRGDTGTCRTCNSNTCRHCRAPAHAGICSEDEDSTVVLDLAKEKGWKACPGCKNMIERIEGCLHMTCTRCPNRTEFCYNCGQLYSQCPGTCRR